MEPDGQLRNLRDFLLVYNKMTEICFNKCISNLNYRSVTVQEEHCVASCAGKLIRTNHRLMGTYVQLMPSIVQKRISEYESMTPPGALPDPQPVPAVSPSVPAADIAANASEGKPTLPAAEVKLDPAHSNSTTSVDSRTHQS